MGFTGGFSEAQLNPDTYQFTVAGDGYTSADRAQKIALLRASELTLKAGYRRFVALSGNVSQQYVGNAPVVVNMIGNTAIATGGGAIMKPGGNLTIHFVKASDPSFAGAFDASLISAQLGPLLKPAQ
ncbi:MAG TPA: hypothetical protein VGH13_04300 [Xanthobacteraceae bacterium]|jgi:hypothetical protein